MTTKISGLSECRLTNQGGVALAVSIILLFVITMLSVSAMRSTNIDTKISINHQFKQMSFQTAESALAKLLGPNPGGSAPTTTPGAFVDNVAYYTSTGVAHQPDMSADLRMEFIEKTQKYKFSGHPLNTMAFVFKADAVGTIGSSNATTHNRMEVARLRQ